MKNYTPVETAMFKAKRNQERSFDREVKGSVWQFSYSLKIWVNSFTRQKATFNPATKSLTFLNS